MTTPLIIIRDIRARHFHRFCLQTRKSRQIPPTAEEARTELLTVSRVAARSTGKLETTLVGMAVVYTNSSAASTITRWSRTGPRSRSLLLPMSEGGGYKI